MKLTQVLSLLVVFSSISNTTTADQVPYSDESVANGAEIYTLYCTACHGADGKATVNFMSDATNLTAPEEFRSGATRQAIFDSIMEGRAIDMPSWDGILESEQEAWDLVNFIQSLWTEEQRNSGQ